MKARKHGKALASLEDHERNRFWGELEEHEQMTLEAYWPLWARREQMPPKGDWRVWLICAGRGFGKTRAGAEWVRHIAEVDDEARIALVARSIGEARSVMVEGESGILACCAGEEDPPIFEPSLRRITWPSGAMATLYAAGEPESLRGPQHSHAWCDELAKWDNASERAMNAWDNLQLGMRLGDTPQILVTTTPRAVPLMRRLIGDGTDPDVVVTRGSTYDNAEHLPADFVKAMKRQFGRTLARHKRNSSSTKRSRGSTVCCTSVSRAKQARRPRLPAKERRGWSMHRRLASGPGTGANWRCANRAFGCSPCRARAW